MFSRFLIAVAAAAVVLGCATPDSIGYLGKRDLVGLRGNWWDG